MAKTRCLSPLPTTQEKGQVFIWLAVALPVFLVMAGWALDMGRALVFKAELTKACDIAASEVAKQISLEEAERTGSTKMVEDLSGRINAHIGANISATYGATITKIEYSISGGPGDPRYIHVQATARIPLLFMKVLGVHEGTVHAQGWGRIRGLHKG